MLLSALELHAYDFYTLLRWIACAVCAYTALKAAQAKKTGWLWIFVTTALVLNPIVPLHLKRDTWALIDVTSAVLLLISIVPLDIRKPRP